MLLSVRLCVISYCTVTCVMFYVIYQSNFFSFFAGNETYFYQFYIHDVIDQPASSSPKKDDSLPPPICQLGFITDLFCQYSRPCKFRNKFGNYLFSGVRLAYIFTIYLWLWSLRPKTIKMFNKVNIHFWKKGKTSRIPLTVIRK